VPFWIFMKWNVTPLESFQHHGIFASRASESLKAASQ
jgi:hypothetical protein